MVHGDVSSFESSVQCKLYRESTAVLSSLQCGNRSEILQSRGVQQSHEIL